MKTCITCGANISHLHGNSKYCLKHAPDVRAYPKKSDYIPATVTMSYTDYSKLKEQSELGKKIQMLDEESKEIVCKLLEKLLRGE